MEAINLTEMIKIRAEAKRENLRKNGQIVKREMQELIKLIDEGEWERFEVRHGDLKKSYDVELRVNAIRSEMQRRDNLLYYAKLQLGGAEL